MHGPLFSVGGLVSGLDTDAIVRQLMDIERIPITRLQQRKGDYQAKVDTWHTVRIRLSALRTSVDGLKERSSFDGFMTATSSDPSAVTAAVSGATSPGAVSFNVDRLATTHQLASAVSFSGAGAVVGAGTFTITRGTQSFSVTTGSSTTLGQLADDINALGAGVQASLVSVDGTSYRLVLTAERSGTPGEFTASGTQTGLDTLNVLQQAQDAQLTIGSGTGALAVTRSSNVIDDLIPGVTLTLRASTTTAVTVQVDRDVDAAVEAIKGLVDKVNRAIDVLADATRFDPETRTAGPLQADRMAWRLLSDLRQAVSDRVGQLAGPYAAASSVGIVLGRDGRFVVNETELRRALEADFDAMARLFGRWGTAADPRLRFVHATDQTLPGRYEVVIIRAPEAPSVTGIDYVAPGVDEVLDITVGGKTVTVTVTAGSTLAQAVGRINDALRAADITTLVASDSGANQIRLSETRYGQAVSFTVANDGSFGLNGTFTGVDVAGTIDGQAATGTGQVLRSDAGSSRGLSVRITATPAEVAAAGGSLSLGTIEYAEGVIGRLSRLVATTEGPGGIVELATGRLASQIELIDDQVQAFEARLELKETILRRRFTMMESALSTLKAQGDWLAAQLLAFQGRRQE